MLFLKPDVTKKNRELFFRRICMESSEHNWANISETICPEILVLASRPLGCCSFQNILTNPIISHLTLTIFDFLLFLRIYN